MKRSSIASYVFAFVYLSLVQICSAGSLLSNKEPKLSDVSKKLAKTRLSWIENKGQQHGDVVYYAKTFSGTVFITHQQELVYSILVDSLHTFPVRESFVNAKAQQMNGESLSQTHVNLFTGKDPSGWYNHLQTFETVSLGELWDGITVKLNAYGANIEKLFYLSPGADPTQISMKIEGDPTLSINKKGELLVKTEKGTLSFTRPLAWQKIRGTRVAVQVKYELHNGDKRYGFTLGRYNSAFEVCIDPLIASTFIGGNGSEWARGIAIDGEGNVFIAGNVSNPNYPTTGSPYDTSFSGLQDVFVSKLSSDLSTLIASTFIGGSSEDWGNAIKIDKSGCVFIIGHTFSTDYPTTSFAYDTSHNGNYDVFISRLNNDLSSLLASTFIGGGLNDVDGHGAQNNLVLDAGGNVFITGTTASSDYPTTSQSFDPSFYPNLVDDEDVYVSKLNTDLSVLLASTFIGGNARDGGTGIALDTAGNVFVTGTTSSSNYPVTGSSYDNFFNGYWDIFVSKFNNTLSTLQASTFIGGMNKEEGSSIALDASGAVFITGTTLSSDYPVKGNPYDPSYNSRSDIFVSKLSNNLSSLISSTFLGGTNDESSACMTLDLTGNVFITGITRSTDYPSVGNIYDNSFNGGISDIFVSELNNELSLLMASTFIGGSSGEDGSGIALTGLGSVYVTGYTSSTNYPLAGTPYDSSFQVPGNDALISKLGIISVVPLPMEPDFYCLCDSVKLHARYEGKVYNWTRGSLHKRDVYVKDTGLFICYIFNNDTLWIDSIRVSLMPIVVHHYQDTFCAGQKVILTASGSAGSTWLWHTPGGNAGAGDTLKQFSASDTGWFYSIIGDSASCPTYDSFYVLIENPTHLFLPTDTSFCEGSSFWLNAFNEQYSMYSWKTGETTSAIKISNPGTYVVTASNSVCSVKDSTRVTDLPLPYLTLPADTLVCFDELKAILLSAPIGYASYKWYPTNETTAAILAKQAIEYTVEVTDEYGCVNTTKTLVDEQCGMKVWIPNIITINGDGLNDKFMIRMLRVKESALTIYNSWGMAVCYSDKLNPEWNGRFSGEAAPAGVYVYKLTCTNFNGKSSVYNGNITLLR